MRFAIVVLAAALLLAGCGDPGSPEARLEATLDAMEEAAEAGERGNFMEHVADDFGGQSGSLDRRGLADLFRVQILTHTRVGALVSNLSIETFGDRATARFNVLLTGGPRAWLPESGRIYAVETGWRDEGGDWRLISAEWRPLAGP